jgi:hypothetical protein
LTSVVFAREDLNISARLLRPVVCKNSRRLNIKGAMVFDELKTIAMDAEVNLKEKKQTQIRIAQMQSAL